MKRFILIFLTLIGMMTAQAQDSYPYLTFETNEGAKVSVPTQSLTITLTETVLTAGAESFSLSNLTKMYFSSEDETTTGIVEITNDMIDEATEIYDLKGVKVAKKQMKQGAYIIKTQQGTFKVIVR